MPQLQDDFLFEILLVFWVAAIGVADLVDDLAVFQDQVEEFSLFLAHRLCGFRGYGSGSSCVLPYYSRQVPYYHNKK